MFHRTADVIKYTELLLRKADGLDKAKNVLLLGIGNFDVLRNVILETADDANVYILDEPVLGQMYTVMKWTRRGNRNIQALEYDFSKFDKNEFSTYLSYSIGNNMKFDYVVMNPPYEKNLHLKILETVMDHISENGTVINLSPVRWLQDTLAKYKKNSDFYKFNNIKKSIQNIDIINTVDAEIIFNTPIPVDLGIYKVSRSINTQSHFGENLIIDKIANKAISGQSIFEKYVTDECTGICCRVSRINETAGAHGDKSWPYFLIPQDRAFYTDTKNEKTGETYFEIAQKSCWGKNRPKHSIGNIKFSSYEERQNFYDSFFTKCMIYYYRTITVDVHNHLRFYPWLGNIKNPRTGKMGYESDWTNRDLCQVFGITGYISDTEAEPGSEWEEILTTMAKYI